MTFKIKINEIAEGDLEVLSHAMSGWQDEMSGHIQSEAERLGISYGAAAGVVYLRTRARWTQEEEDRLISLAKQGK